MPEPFLLRDSYTFNVFALLFWRIAWGASQYN
jgi:hypothetical protein